MAPVGPAGSNRLDHRAQERDLPYVLENLGVFVILNAVSNGLQTDARSRLRGSDRTGRVDKDSIAGPTHAAAATGGVHIVPTANGVPSGPPVCPPIENAC